MGTWTLEQNIGVTFSPDTFNYFGGTLYLSTRDGRIYRRVGTTWNLVRNVGATYPQNVVKWQGRLWTFDDDEVLSSADGTAWTVDVDLRALNGDVAYTIRTVNYNNTKLFVAGLRRPGGATYFYERDTSGNWTLSPPASPGNGWLTTDFIEWGNYYYACRGGDRFYRWTGAAWQDFAGLVAHYGWCTVQGDVMWVKVDNAAPNSHIFWVNPDTDVWTEIYDLPYRSDGSRIAIDASGQAWFAVNNTVNRAYIYRHQPPGDPAAGWSLFDDTTVGNTDDARVACALSEHEILLATRLNNEVHRWIVSSWNVHPPGPGVGSGLNPQIMDADGDGDRLYIGLYGAGNTPRLISVALPLDGVTSVGFSMFNPGAGDAINVKCTDIGNNLAISGKFAANNENVETSDDAGLTWVDIDRDAWGADTAQPLEVSPITLDEVMVCLDAGQIVTETYDAGATAWSATGAALGYSAGAMALLINGTEMILSDDAANQVDYSPNRGVTLNNITAPGFAGGGVVAAMAIT